MVQIVCNVEEFERFCKNELVYVKRYIPDLPYSMVQAFYKEFEGLSEEEAKEKQRELYDMYRLSTSRELLNLALSINDEVEIVFRPETFIATQSGRITLITKGGSYLHAPADLFGNSLKEIENNISDWLFVVVTKPKSLKNPYSAEIVEATPLKGKTDTKNAKRILEEYDFKPAELLVAAFGVIPDIKAIRLFAPRFIPLFTYEGRPQHILQFTNKDSGKSEFGIKLEFILQWTHFSEFPTPARLIYDGRAGTPGAVFTSNGIVIDEFDKVKGDLLKDAYQPINTGLENGVWRRGVQTREGRVLEVYRAIPFIFFGNISRGELPLLAQYTSNPREHVEKLIESKISGDASAFVERLTLCDIYPDRVPISGMLIRNKNGAVGVLPDSTIRGLISILQNRIKHEFVEESDTCNGRYRRSAEATYNILRMLFDTELDENVIRDIIIGEKDIGHVISSVYSNTNNASVKELIESIDSPESNNEIKVIEIDMTELFR